MSKILIDEATVKLVLEALERVDAIERGMVTTSRHHYQAKEDTTKAIAALREALAEQPAQEPVAWERPIVYTPPHMVAPAHRKPLTDEQIIASNYPDGEENGPTIPAPDFELICFARQIEAAHGIKENT